VVACSFSSLFMNSPVVENGSSMCSGSDPPTIPIPTPFVFVIDKNVPDEISPVPTRPPASTLFQRCMLRRRTCCSCTRLNLWRSRIWL
jgi:hypothetical protein